MARPTEYKEEYCDKVDEYLELNQDSEMEVVKYQGEKSTGYEQKLKVKLPTLKGFALFIDVNESTLYEWDKRYPLFSKSLDKIRTEQHDRLINSGLSGEYNSTIAKLILSSNHGMRERNDITSNDEPILNEQAKEKSKEAIASVLSGGNIGTGGEVRS